MKKKVSLLGGFLDLFVKKSVAKPKKDRREDAYKRAVDSLRRCSTEQGLFASGGKYGYKGVWSRDSFISFIGGSLVNGKDGELFRKTFRKSLEVLGNNQSPKGQIPNSVHDFQKKRPYVDFSTIDSSLWYIIGHFIYKKRYNDASLFKKYKKTIERALNWLKYQDFGEDVMLEQLPTSDWQDAFPEKYGKTINTQAMYYFVLRLMGEKKLARKLKHFVNNVKGIRLWNGKFYYAYRWKNHNEYKEVGTWFASLGNLMAIIFDLADEKQAKSIIRHIKKNGIHRPYPVRTIYPPITPESEYWEDYYLDCEAGEPNHYLNGGIWTFIGGFYVLSLIKLKRFKEAETELKLLAEANLLKNSFPEWIDPEDLTTHGIFQAWSAGMYIAAYESLKKKKFLL